MIAIEVIAFQDLLLCGFIIAMTSCHSRLANHLYDEYMADTNLLAFYSPRSACCIRHLVTGRDNSEDLMELHNMERRYWVRDLDLVFMFYRTTSQRGITCHFSAWPIYFRAF